MDHTSPFYPTHPHSKLIDEGILMRNKLAHDYLCASITSGVAWTSDEFLIESVFNLADKFIEYANNNLSNK